MPAGELLVRYANQTVTYGATATPSLLSAQYRDQPINQSCTTCMVISILSQIRLEELRSFFANGAIGNVSVGAYNMAATTVTQTSPNFR